MLDHIGLSVADLQRSTQFFIAALAPLSVTLVAEVTAEESGGDAHAGFGRDGKPFFWIGDGEPRSGPMHVAFTASTRDAVDAFYRAALDAGATDNGPPGIRASYHPNYYAAYVLDPDGVNVEAVCHSPA